MKNILAAACLLLAVSASPQNAFGEQMQAQAILVDRSGAEIGNAALVQAPSGVLIHLSVEGLTPGKHGLHLHSHGVCDADTGFKTAKGHVGKIADSHGLMNPKGPEPGDIPNIFIGADGTGEIEILAAQVSLSGEKNNLLDADGSTFIIHEKADDHITQPIGGAGGRVACGIIKAK